MLSSPFIMSPDYGTRCSTILTIDGDGAARFVERSFDPAGEATGEVDVRFALASLPASAEISGCTSASARR